MERVALYKRVVGLDIHQAQITACALIGEPDGSTRIEQRQFGGFNLNSAVEVSKNRHFSMHSST